ncbi:membrane protein [Gordonia phage Finkle]|uniref:Membrane protein n=1 Tax=Gordonia phage Finkle TaxID=2926099 RepID=A0A9E7NJG2_9CAUD|nr:membrane protein [Gordonia phage Finkle]UTN92941.1 membrane protein [Gordonia phage Finkle]
MGGVTSLPTTLHPLIVVGVLVLSIVVPAAAGVWVAQISHRQKGHSEVLEEVREQVSNSHDSNLRDDVDRVDEKVDQVDTKVDQLTGKFDALARGLELFMHESRKAQARQDRIAAKYHPNEP